MPFYQEEKQFHKTALSDLQGTWQNLRDEVVSHHPFADSDRILFQIDEGMSWESVNNLKHMSNIILFIRNLATQSKAPEEVIELIKCVKEDLDGVFEDIADGKISFHPNEIKRKITHKHHPEPVTFSEDEKQNYLKNTEIINWQHASIVELSEEIKSNCTSELEYAQKAFEYVRDKIKHSWDYKINPVTCGASEVLKYKTGYCYAKSHLLAALLRAQKIPTGFCYQRLSLENNGPPYCLHGLNAVFLEKYGWHRIDARGNKEGVSAQFTPPVECLAFSAKGKLEKDLPEIWSDPLPSVIEALESNKNIEELYNKLPDIQVLKGNIG